MLHQLFLNKMKKKPLKGGMLNKQKKKKWHLSSKWLMGYQERSQLKVKRLEALPTTDELRILEIVTWPLCASVDSSIKRKKGSAKWQRRINWRAFFPSTRRPEGKRYPLSHLLHQGEQQLDGVCLRVGQFLTKLSSITNSRSQQRAGPYPVLNPLWLRDAHIYSFLKTQFQRLTAEGLSWVSSHCEV